MIRNTCKRLLCAAAALAMLTGASLSTASGAVVYTAK